MEREIILDAVYDKVDFRESPWNAAEYENCTFNNCTFNEVALDQTIFLECEFVDCDWSSAGLVDTALRDCIFKQSKLQGLRFDDCSDFLFQINCQNCVLDWSSFTSKNLSNCKFSDCQMKEVDFRETVFSKVRISQCDFQGANFDRTDLSNADLRKAHNYSINPNENRLKKTKFSSQGIVGLVRNLDIIID